MPSAVLAASFYSALLARPHSRGLGTYYASMDYQQAYPHKRKASSIYTQA